MTTFKDLQNVVLNTLHGQTADQEERCALTTDITAGATSFVVDDVTQVSRGLIEIDSELMWVKSIDSPSNTVNISPFGRGYGETTAVSHTANTMVMNNPRFPRQYVKDAITECLSEVYPDLFQVKKDESNRSVSTTITYGLPADCDIILSISWQSVGPTKRWVPVRRYAYDANADTTAFPNGKAVDIYDPMTPGRTIKVSYIAAPASLVNDSDTLASTGLGEGVKDVLVYGACARLLRSLEASRLQTATIEQGDRASVVPPGSATAASNAYWVLHQQRLQDERDRLQRLYQPSVHLTR